MPQMSGESEVHEHADGTIHSHEIDGDGRHSHAPCGDWFQTGPVTHWQVHDGGWVADPDSGVEDCTEPARGFWDRWGHWRTIEPTSRRYDQVIVIQ
jgi:hypothetical protein